MDMISPGVSVGSATSAIIDSASAHGNPVGVADEAQEKSPNVLKEVIVNNDDYAIKEYSTNSSYFAKHVAALISAVLVFTGSIFCTVHTFNHLLFKNANWIAVTWSAMIFSGVYILLIVVCIDYYEDPEWYWAMLTFRGTELTEQRQKKQDMKIYELAYRDIITTLHEKGEIICVDRWYGDYDDYMAMMDDEDYDDNIENQEIGAEFEGTIDYEEDAEEDRAGLQGEETDGEWFEELKPLQEKMETNTVPDTAFIGNEVWQPDQVQLSQLDSSAELAENEIITPEETDITTKKNQ